MKNLQLSLKTKWFEMTKSGIKTEDYRDITPYWINRLIIKSFRNEDTGELHFIFKVFKNNIMTLGYPKKDDKDRILILENKEVTIGYGNPEWGAEPNKLYFIIKHGKQL
jgi:hypothetical protein